MNLYVYVCVSSPSPLHDVLVDYSISEDVFVEELIGEEYQQCGHCFKLDAIGDVTTGTDRRMCS